MAQQTQSNESVPYWAMRRATDRSRLVLRNAIHRALRGRRSAMVIDVASGGGLLASWAGEVLTDGTIIAVEDDQVLWRATVAGLREHRNRSHLNVLKVDNLLEWTPPEPWDLLLCDVLSSGLIAQPQAALLNHFLQFRNPDGEVIPLGVSHVIELLGLGLDRLPVQLPRICFQDETGVSEGCEMSPVAEAGFVYFNSPIGDHFQLSTGVVANASGLVDAVRLSTVLLTTAQEQASGHPRVAAPIVAPLPRTLKVVQGENVSVRGVLRHGTADENGRATVNAVPSRLEITVEVARCPDRDSPSCR